MHRVAIYARVSTDDQDCERQLHALEQAAQQRGYTIVARVSEKRSGTRLEAATSTTPINTHAAKRFSTHAAKRFSTRAAKRLGTKTTKGRTSKRANIAERNKVLALAREGKIDAVFVHELSRWGRSTIDLLTTLDQLTKWNVSLLCLTGIELDVSNATGRLLASLLTSIASFERDIIAERTKNALQRLKSRGVQLGRQKGFRPSEKHRDACVTTYAVCGSISETARRLNLNPRTVRQYIPANG